jgi:hypothetical protein
MIFYPSTVVFHFLVNTAQQQGPLSWLPTCLVTKTRDVLGNEHKGGLAGMHVLNA